MANRQAAATPDSGSAGRANGDQPSRRQSMAARKIMIIRHAEKPDDADQGVTPAGLPDREDLTVRGWQRAGALGRFFAPRDERFADPHLATPDVIFASQVGPQSPSARPMHTVTPL